MAISVSTRSYDNARSGANTRETELTADAVGTRGVRRLYSIPLSGDSRGIEAQPLVAVGVTVPDGRTCDLLVLATMANTVAAYELIGGGQVWTRNLGRPVDSNTDIDGHRINDHWGVLSTPVIDQATGTIYVLAWVSSDGSVDHARYHLYALRIADGVDAQQPLDLEGTTYDPGHGLPDLRFASAGAKQRASLLLTSLGGVTTVFAGFGFASEPSDSQRGWVIAAGTSPFAVTAAWASTARGHGGGIWQAGAGLTADARGFLYLMTGNGDFDAVTEWGESFVKLAYTPPHAGVAAGLRVVDWWTPFTDDARTGGRVVSLLRGLRRRLVRPAPVATNVRRYATARGRLVALALGEDIWDDMDLGSGGPVVLESLGLVIGAGKDGILYVLDQNNMGQTTPADLEHPAANYQKLKKQPIFFTYYPPELSPSPDDIASLNVLHGGRTHHLHGSPVFWESPDHGPMLFCWGENESLRAWTIGRDGAVTYRACGAETASAKAQGAAGGMPGGMLTLSANGTQPHTGVVWALIPYGDANTKVTNGRLLAYDASRFDTLPDGTQRLRVLWDSEDWNLPFLYNKFNLPVAANGRLIVPTYEGRVDIYTL
jgi:hypothetical protein